MPRTDLSDLDLRRDFHGWIITKTVTSFLRSYCRNVNWINEDHVIAIYVLREVPRDDPEKYEYKVIIVTTNGVIRATIKRDSIYVEHVLNNNVTIPVGCD